MKRPRQSFAEAACLYQNDRGKATVLLWYGMAANEKPRNAFHLTPDPALSYLTPI